MRLESTSFAHGLQDFWPELLGNGGIEGFASLVDTVGNPRGGTS